MDWIDAEEARKRLGVRAQTLYAYVSRGRVRMRPDPQDPRRSLYRAADIAALAQRKTRSRKAAEVATGAIAWGEPVLASAITTVSSGRLFYRGRDAVALALAAEATAVLDALADAVAGQVSDGQIHQHLAAGWGLEPSGPGADLIRRALVLMADHELNASTFAARVAASTGASLAASALAGLAALSGPRHGGAAAALRNLMREAGQAGPRAAIAARLAEERGLPGFGHLLYPDGDPRARALLDRFAAPATLADLAEEAASLAGAKPNIDFALVAMSDALGLPAEAPFALFATARCAGWIAHAVEQVQEGGLIRPRARYTGAAVD